MDTHTTDWVALELEADIVLEIELSRQEGVYESPSLFKKYPNWMQ